jgi:hypothetical protein
MHGEISLLGVTYGWVVFGRVIVVTAPDGRQKDIRIGGSSPEILVRLLARELAGQPPG